MEVQWIETTKDIYYSIFSHHGADLNPYSSYTDMDGTQPFSYGIPQMCTEWKFRNSNCPLLRINSIKRGKNMVDVFDAQYYIAVITVQHD